MKKLICFDLDGTLTQHRSPLCAENRAELDRLGQKYKLLMVGAGAASQSAKLFRCKRIFSVGRKNFPRALDIQNALCYNNRNF